MGTLIDTSVWIDAFHSKTPTAIKLAATAAINRPDALLCEPVHLEFFRGVPERDLARAEKFLGTVPVLRTPSSLWSDALAVLRDCERKGAAISTLDALIAVIALKHAATIATFDRDFLALQTHCGVSVELLSRAT